MTIRKLLPGLLLLLGLLCAPRPAGALELKSGQEVALSIDAAVGVGGIVSTIGNAVTVARGAPVRGWLLSGYVLGTLNLVVSPLLLVYGQDPSPELGLGLGAVHGAIGIANMVVALYGGVLWRRRHRPDGTVITIAPLSGQDSAGLPYVGAGVLLSRF